MDKNIFFRIKDYLKVNGIADIDKESKMQLRAEGKSFSTEEHIKGLIYSLLSAQTVWANIEKNFKNIDNLFGGYLIDEIRKHDATYYVEGLKKIRCGSRSTHAQMNALHENISTIEKIINEYGSMDNFVTSKPSREIVKILSSGKSEYKIKQMGSALAWEYLRNIGIDGAKPDVHMKRILSVSRLGVSNRDKATDDEVLDAIESLSKETGFWMAEIDYLFWAYCATGKGEICTANPSCDKCVIRDYCNKYNKNQVENNKEATQIEIPVVTSQVTKQNMKRTQNTLDSGQVLNVIQKYTEALDLLDSYDHQTMKRPKGNAATYELSYEECMNVISQMRFGAESDLFGKEKDGSFKGSIGNIYQSFAGRELYPSIEEKAAHLLYFVTKNHSFWDGNKRIAATMFLYFLDKNGALFMNDEKLIDDHTIVALTIMIAESQPKEKDMMITVVMNCLRRAV